MSRTSNRMLTLALAPVLLAGFATATAVTSAAVVTPSVTWVSPRLGAQSGGTLVTVTGRHFTHASKVFFGYTLGTHLHVVSDRRLTVRAPKHRGSTVHVRVAVGYRKSPTSARDQYRYEIYRVTSVQANRGPITGDTEVVITGERLSTVTSINFGYTTVTHFDHMGTTKLFVLSPPHALRPVHVVVHGTYGRSLATSQDVFTYTAPDGIVTVVSQTVDRPSGGLYGISCPTTTFCAAVDEHGSAELYRNGTWEVPKYAVHGVHEPLQAVSCTSATFCVAIGAVSATAWDGISWSPFVQIAFGEPGSESSILRGVSCVSPTYCIAADNLGYLIAYDGVSWRTLPVDGFRYAGSGISCTSTVSCTRIQPDGKVDVLFGSGHPVYDIDRGHVLITVSCPSGFCAMVDDRGFAVVGTPPRWSAPTDLHLTDPSTVSVSCDSASSCVAVSGTQAVNWNGSSWTLPTVVCATAALNGVSCASATRCVATDRATGKTWTYANGSWGNPVLVAPVSHGFDHVSCVSAMFCVTTDRTGLASVYTGGAVPVPTRVEPGTQLSSVSCASSQLCAVVDRAGYAAVRTASGWQPAQQIDLTHPLSAVSCAATVCKALDESGQVYTFSGGSWSGPVQIPGNPLRYDSLTCSSASSCRAAGVVAGGTPTFHQQQVIVSTFDGSWRTPVGLAIDAPRADIACSSTGHCLLTNGGTVRTLDPGGSWTAPHLVSYGSGVSAISCVGPSFCLYSFANPTSTVVVDGTPTNRVAHAPSFIRAPAVSCWAPRHCVAFGDD